MTLTPQHPTKKYQVVGIGNAIVDVLTRADDSFLEHMGIEKGIMQLVERERAEQLYGAMESRVQAPGGSVANTLAGLGNLGLRTGFIGRVHDDALGRFYADAMEKDGSDFVNAPVPGGELPTSRSMIFVSPDGERSMNTYLGISSELGPEDVSEDVSAQAEIIFLEGYLFDKPKGKEAFLRAARTCRKAGGLAGIAISDPRKWARASVKAVRRLCMTGRSWSFAITPGNRASRSWTPGMGRRSGRRIGRRRTRGRPRPSQSTME